MASIEYLAGLFDGEGSFSIQIGLRHYGDASSVFINPSMSVNLYYGSGVLDHFVTTFGGKVYAYQRDGVPRGNRWHLGNRIALVTAATTLLPLLEIKREIAANFLRALALFPAGTGANRRAGERIWTPDRAVEVAEIALALNPPRARKSNKTQEYLEVLRAGLAGRQAPAFLGNS